MYVMGICTQHGTTPNEEGAPAEGTAQGTIQHNPHVPRYLNIYI